jgi:hypothetical protein
MYLALNRKAVKQKNKPARRHTSNRALRNTSPLRLELLEDRTVLTGFYNYDVIAKTGQGISGILPEASINDAGKVAFVGQYQDANQNPAGEGVFVGDGNSLKDISFTNLPASPNRSYGAGVQINNSNDIATVDRYSFGGTTQWRLRTWNADSQSFTIYATASSPPSAGFDFDALAGSVSLSNNGNLAYASFDYQASRWQLRLQNDVLPNALDVPAATLDAPQALRPMAADGTDSRGLFVVRKGNTSTSPINLYGKLPGGGFSSTTIASTGVPNRFSALGQSPGISDDGQVVVFYGVDGSGEGIFASVNTQSHGRQIVRIAADSSNGPISFEPDERIGVNATESSQGAVTITYVGSDINGNKGVYASRLTFIPPANNPTDFADATSFVVSDPIPVLQEGDPINGLGTVQDVKLYDPINNTGFGQIAIWAQGSGATGVVRATSPGLSAIANRVRYTVNGAAISATFQPLLYQYGKPAAPMTLADAAKALAVDHFNWLQYVTALPSTWSAAVASPVAFTNPGDPSTTQPEWTESNGQLVTRGNPQYSDGTPIDLASIAAPLQKPGLVDPFQQTPNGQQAYLYHDTASDLWNLWDAPFADNQPGYYNEAATPNLPASANNVDLADQMVDSAGNKAGATTATVLQFFDKPEQNRGTIPGGQFLSFKTMLVGIRTDGTVLEFPNGLGTAFTWKSNAEKTLGAYISDPGGPTNYFADAYFNDVTGVLNLNVHEGPPSTQLDVVVNGVRLGSLTTDANGAALTVWNNVAVQAGQSITVGPLSGTFGNDVLGGVGAVSFSWAPSTSLPPVASGGVFDAVADNSPPPADALLLAPINNLAVDWGKLISLTAIAADPIPGAAVTFSLAPGAPLGAVIDPSTGAFSWTPTIGQAGQVYTITVNATDNNTPALSAMQSFVVNVQNKLSVTAVTELAPPTPGPLQVAVDINEALQPTVAQNVALYKIAREDNSSLPIQSAVYSDNGSQHRVVLTVAAGTPVIPGFYHVYVDAAELTATNGDTGAPKTDQLWVDVTGENTLKPIAVQADGSYAVSGSGFNLGYGPPQKVLAGNFAGNGRTDLIVQEGSPGGFFNPCTLLLLKSNGDGTYAPPVQIPLGGAYQILTLNSVDWNHDGSPDLVAGVGFAPNAGSTTKYQYFVLLNDGHGSFTNAPDTPIPVAPSDPTGGGIPLTATGIYDLKGDGAYEIVHNEGGGGTPAQPIVAEVIGKDQFVGYSPQMEIPINGPGYISELAFADLNGDGKPDIIAGLNGFNLDNPNFSVMLSTPTGFAGGQHIADGAGGADPEAISVGNFAGGEHNDIATVYGTEIHIYQNDGKGNLTLLQPIVLDTTYTVRSATFADVNHDGIPDAVLIAQLTNGPNGSGGDVGNGAPLFVWTFLADGHGGFSPTSSAPLPIAGVDQSPPTTVTLADLDGDGNPDVILGSNQLGAIRIGINDGTGTMRPPVQPPPFLGQPANGQGSGYPGLAYQAFADFNNSGHLGFATIVTDNEPGGVEVYVGKSDGTFDHTASLPEPPAFGYHLTWLKVGDLNNDGIPDILFGDSAHMAVYLGNGDGSFRQAPTFLYGEPGSYFITAVALADVNHDGNLDVVANLGDRFEVFFGDGKGNLSLNANTMIPISLYAPGQANPAIPVLGDFNRDGKLDLLVPNTDNQGNFELTDYLGRGNGTFSPGPVIYSGSNTTDTQILIGDFNGDGIPDLLTYANFALGTIGPPATAHVFLGNGDGSFRTAPDLDFTIGLTLKDGTSTGPINVVLGDFNGDGKLDVAASFFDPYSAADQVALYTGDGTAHFSAPQDVTVGLSPFTLVSIPRAPFLDAGTFAVTDHGPVANNDVASVVSGTSVGIPVLANDSDPDKAPLEIVQVATPAHGTAHTDGSGTIYYAPALGFTGTDAFNYTIADPAGAEATATVTVTVTKSSTSSLQFSTATYSISQTGGNAVISVSRTGDTSGSVTVHYATAAGTAVNGADYTATSGNLTFAAGVVSQSFSILILSGGGGGTVNLSLTGATGGAALGTPSSAVLTITHSQSSQLQFGSAAYSATEGGANVTISVTRTGGSDGQVTIDFSTAGGTASPGTDYTDTTGTLTFAAGVTSQTFTIPILSGGSGGTVNLSLINPRGGATLGTPASAVLTISGSTGLASQLHFSVANTQAPRNAGTAVVTVVRSGGLSGAVTVHYATSDGSALAGADYSASSGTLTFGAGASTQTITIPIINNPQSHGSKTVNISLDGPTGGAVLNAPSSALLTIIDPLPTEPMPGNLVAVGNAFTHSSEAFARFVTGAYNLYLKRLPEQQGLGYWVDQLQNHGLTDEKLETGFLSSVEYIANHGGTGTAWVIGMYQDLLGRNPDSGGLSYWTNVLARGGSAYSVAIGFAASAEREGQRIGGDYQIFLGRRLDEAGQAYWVAQFLAGARNEDVVAGFIGSQEYYQNPNKGQTNHTAWIDSVFQDVLQRNPISSEVAYWLTQLQ